MTTPTENVVAELRQNLSAHEIEQIIKANVRVRVDFPSDITEVLIFGRGSAASLISARISSLLDSLEASQAREAASQARVTALEAEKAGLVKAVEGPFAVVFLDGRNEHGTHVLCSFPTNLPIVDSDIGPYAEEITSAAEALGFKPGEDHVWTIWRWNPPHYGDEGRIELDGCWEFDRIDKPMSDLIRAQALSRSTEKNDD